MKATSPLSMALSVLTLCISASLHAKPHDINASSFKRHTNEQRYIIHYNRDTAADILSPTATPLLSAHMQVANLHGKTHHILSKQHAVAATLTEATVKQLQQDPTIDFIEVDPVRELAHAGLFTYGVEMIQAPLVTDTNSSNQKVCIIDTGYDATHEDLPSGANVTGEVVNTLTESVDISAWNEDVYGHGTHITGTIAALSNNIGYEGILPSGQLNIHHVKIIDNPNYFPIYGSDLAAAINACAAANATVINMSIAGPNASQVEQNAADAAYEEGALLVAAAGNRGNTQAYYPASYDSVISVGAIDKHKAAWRYTQTNEQVELVAPGVEVRSTLPNNRYASWDGTSMATPHVSGVAALVWSHFPECNNVRIRQALTASAEDLGDAGKDTTFGHGIVQAKAAVDWLDDKHCNLPNKPLEALEYEQIYGLNIPNQGSYYYQSVPYDVDHTDNNYPNGISRIAYHMQLQSGDTLEWVWVSFDAHTQELNKLGVPTHASNIEWNQLVNNLTVYANNEKVKEGHFDKGVIEFWPWNYSCLASKNIPNGSNSSCDFDDTPHRVFIGHGSMQIHNADIGKTIFAYNYFNRAVSRSSSIGIGSAKNNRPDWSNSYNAHQYSVKRLEVWVKPNK